MVVSFFPYFLIPATPKEQWGKDGLLDGERPMRKSSPQGWPPKPVAFGSSLGSSLVLVSALSYPCRGRNNLQCDTWVQVFLPWHNTAAAVINITWCGPYHLGSNGLFLNAFIMTHWPGTIVCPPSGGVCQHDSTLSLALCTAFVRFSQ